MAITDQDIVDRRYTALGDITVRVNKTTIFHPSPTPELVNDRLREKAAAMGADAVVLVRYGDVGISMMGWGTLEGKGRAIKFVPWGAGRRGRIGASGGLCHPGACAAGG